MRKFIFVFLFLTISLSYLFEVDELLAKKFTFFNDLKLSYIDKMISISSSIEKHFNQTQTIEQLRAENNTLKEYQTLYTTSQKQLETLKEFFVNVEFPQNNSIIELVKVLSYISYDDFTKVWLDKEPENDKIFGLISDNYAAGIALNRNGKLVGLLNGNKDCSYAVFLGEGKYPGILTSSDTKDEVQIKYIPFWADIKKGDEVITSGMDNIFFEGLKVGRITEITNLPDMKIATVKPYANVLKKKFFYSYKTISNLEINETKKEEKKATSN